MTDSLVRRWDVCKLLFPFGAGRSVGHVEAETRAEAQELARTKYGAGHLVFQATAHSANLDAYGRHEPVRWGRR